MSTAIDNGSGDRRHNFISKLTLPQPTKDPTVVFNHLKACAVAFQRDGRGDDAISLDVLATCVLLTTRCSNDSTTVADCASSATVTAVSSIDQQFVDDALPAAVLSFGQRAVKNTLPAVTAVPSIDQNLVEDAQPEVAVLSFGQRAVKNTLPAFTAMPSIDQNFVDDDQYRYDDTLDHMIRGQR